MFIKNTLQGRRFVIPDIHGCYRTFLTLVEKLEITKADQLFLLGDYISRGSGVKATIDHILNLQALDYQVYPIRGNHEQSFLETASSTNLKILKAQAKRSKCLDLLDYEGQLKPRYAQFLQKLPFYLELDNFYLVHAGFNFMIEEPLQDMQAMVWIRTISETGAKWLKDKTLIHGHTPQQLFFIEKAIAEKRQILNLDNGCVYVNRNNMGNLLALNIDTFELTIQQNIDPISI